MATEKDLIFFHLSDLHLTKDSTVLVNNRSPLAKLSDLLEHLHRLEVRPSFILITGDLVNDGQPDQYKQFVEMMPAFAEFGVPLLLGLGNHDAIEPFRQIVRQENTTTPYYHSTVIDGLNVIVLDSHVPDQVYGYLDKTQLTWLDHELAKPMSRGHLIALHHPPVPVTVRFLDQLCLSNVDEFAAVVRRHQQVLGILSGHIHYSHVAPFANTISITIPAVHYTIDPSVQQNLRILDSSGFGIGTIRNNQLLYNTVMMAGNQEELAYRNLPDND